jgi:hypothetical protein
MSDSTALVLQDERSIDDVVRQVGKVQNLMQSIMRIDEHFGVIPGTGKKPSLYKSGAEKLCFTFRLAPEFEVERIDLPNGHREYNVKCRLRSMGSNTIVGEGVGSCSTMESKYRYRNASDYEILDNPIPRDARERKAEYRKQGFGMKQVDGSWVWVRYTSEGKVENPDIADTYNTVLKMGKKRAFVDATITATAASDIFTQDVEDFAEHIPEAGKMADEPKQPEPLSPAVQAIYQQYETYIASGLLKEAGVAALRDVMARKETNVATLEKGLTKARKAHDEALAAIDKEGSSIGGWTPPEAH